MDTYSHNSTNTDAADSASSRAELAGGATAHPRIVIRGETINTPPNNLCYETLANKISHIDWLSFSVKGNHDTDFYFVPLLKELREIFNIKPFDWVSEQKGWFGYTNKATLNKSGIVAWGGESQKGTVHVELTAIGCSQVRDWIGVYRWGVVNNAKITRLDIAHDDEEGTIVNIKQAQDWYKNGLFSHTGRPPSARLIDDFDIGEGKTLYVGKRKNGKLIRVYEKGRQLGQPESEWCRAELMLRNKDRVITWDTVINPDHYLAGSCKAFEYLSVVQNRIKTLQREEAISLERSIYHCKQAYGPLINILHKGEGYDYEDIFKMLCRDGVPEKLKHIYSPSELGN